MAALERLLPRLSKETSLSDCNLYYDKNRTLFNRSKLHLTITAMTHGSSKNWPTFPCSLWFATNEKVKVSCVNVNCKFKGEREWQGKIVGKGIHGPLNALLAMIKHKNKISQGRTPLIELLAICDGCCGQLDFCCEAGHMNRVTNKASGSLVLGLSDKEVEEVVSSKVIIMKGMLMNSITTIGVDGRWREWPILRPFSIN